MDIEKLTYEQLQQLIDNYRDLLVDQSDDDAYVARGNGFCDTKYSTDFIECRIAQLEEQMARLRAAEQAGSKA